MYCAVNITYKRALTKVAQNDIFFSLISENIFKITTSAPGLSPWVFAFKKDKMYQLIPRNKSFKFEQTILSKCRCFATAEDHGELKCKRQIK
jgi:hypothetical protein